MSAVFTVYWNRHTKFKKNQINGKPSRGVMICDLVSTKKYRLVIQKLYWKSVLRNELSSMKIHVFQAKWRMLWPHSWNSLLKCAHIRHRHTSWNHEQCFWIKFSFSVHKKIIYHIPSEKMGYFLKQVPKICGKLGEIHFLKILYHIIFKIN